MHTDIIYIYIETRVSSIIILIKKQFPVDEKNNPASGVLPAGPRGPLVASLDQALAIGSWNSNIYPLVI